jgi:hypothetical protein
MALIDPKKIKQVVLSQGMKLLGNPRVTKAISDPRVMKAIMQVLQLRSTLQSQVTQRKRDLASTFSLATADELRALQNKISALEKALGQIQSKVDNGAGKTTAATAPAAS